MVIWGLLKSFKGLVRANDPVKFAEGLRRAAGLRLGFLPWLVTLLEANPGNAAVLKLSCASKLAFCPLYWFFKVF